ncbi:tRNA (adenosine(37)-N6)-threonylcarbamoyltransferase complex ATPase subunit type 1 TsaE [Rhodohalobacter sp.]|uniref:tRNA (adenosine(37)-N6)-threonylcarbamoyltransferase complex ATPase subunit type 1 TsaE n=1 Tax=Rhodohalobacter sp. TaxID=1974210 RepID=UPI002ACE2BA2|nr:tRNA (adenosine(37)-N6)-threonylcarbamoyltransferase complex ATPase subunit type 1 TsaE [Rhodohalobacter sp.]MDZ7758148.1 tRNA (adenosine(37)-N6)-threonylcarbamoyltransferase complex ATPase subunit type 1 TsaE [Rhodohalobacter sp.]
MEKKISRSEEETFRIAKDYAKQTKPGDVICLEGDLGAGKTHFTKGFVMAFGLEKEIVSSPTFALINEYQGDNIEIFHFDCYRLEDVREALEIGAEEYFYGDGICIIEWPERIRAILPSHSKTVTITSTGPSEREIRFNS